MAERRLRDAKPCGGAGKASFFSNNRERRKLAEIVSYHS
jgi:hypothetical protein